MMILMILVMTEHIVEGVDFWSTVFCFFLDFEVEGPFNEIFEIGL